MNTEAPPAAMQRKPAPLIRAVAVLQLKLVLSTARDFSRTARGGGL